MENSEQGDPSHVRDEPGSIANKNEENAENPGKKDATKTDQEKFIGEIENTENFIDPGNEHHHHANEVDKNIGQ